MRFGGEAVVGSVHEDEDVSSIRRRTYTLRPTSRGKIIGQNERIRSVLETIDRVARSSCTVLVTGESGTGKELVVAALHDASLRKAGPLVTINCGAIPNELVESELFGHTRGAFTGAQQQRRGHVAAAEGGTLFLDEIGELPMPVQVKLLRLLQQREYTPLGESRPTKCDVRIVAATNRDLEAEVAAGRFREDLFYRLNVIHLHLPALRERGTDVKLLALSFFARFAEISGRSDLRGFSPAALAAIEAHPWPGNVRALENAVERSVLLARGPMVEPDDILGRGNGIRRPEAPAPVAAAAPAPRPPQPMAAPPQVTERVAEVPGPSMLELPVSPMPVAVIAAQAARAFGAEASGGLSVPLVGGPERRASNPMFPRQLPDVGVDLFSAVESYQNNLIRQALARTGGNKNRAAQLLGLNRTTLVEMIRRRGLGS